MAAVAWASIPDASGLISGCFKKSGGALRVIDNSVSSCKGDESALEWNQRGPQGPPGPPGPASVTVRIANGHISAASSSAGLDASCLPGEVATGGGYELGNGTVFTGENLRVLESRPSGPFVDGRLGWRVTVAHTPVVDGDADFRIYVACASPGTSST